MREQGRLWLDEMITRCYRLDEVNEAFDAVRNRDVGRGAIVVN